MRKQRLRKYLHSGLLTMLVVAGGIGSAAGETATSSNYMVTETQFGSGSAVQCSTQYCANSSTGDLVDGSASSQNYSAAFGSNTSAEPYLEVYTEGGKQELGTLDVNRTAVATNTIKVRTYLSGGYIMQVTGKTPSQGTHELTALTTPSTSHQGAEQFGINMVANTEPAVGANPVQVPSSLFSTGYITDDYGTPNLFKYINGDIVAQSDKSSGETDYTMSIMINVSNITPGGHYDGSLSAVVVPYY